MATSGLLALIDDIAGTLGWVGPLASSLSGALVGMLAGALVVAVVSVWARCPEGGAPQAGFGASKPCTAVPL